ncbi:hypothetical protein glysoja_001034 [Glycine soja]|nr:hypothetical protein glysoja_001034 [Glycine soja]
MLLSYSLHLPITSSYSHTSNRSPNSSGYIKFRTRYRENLRYLRALTIIDPKTKPEDLPLPNDVDHIIDTLTFLKSHSFSDADIPRLKFLTPELFTTAVVPSDVSAVFRFLAASPPRNPSPATSSSDAPNSSSHTSTSASDPRSNFSGRNAHLLNTRVDKLHAKVEFLQELGFSYEEAVRACARLPAIFGYDVENNLWPKFVYLVKEMERDLEDLKRFPQYFGFSLKERIVPRHLHLKKRGVRIPLNRMLMWADPKFYAKWK